MFERLSASLLDSLASVERKCTERTTRGRNLEKGKGGRQCAGKAFYACSYLSSIECVT